MSFLLTALGDQQTQLLHSGRIDKRRVLSYVGRLTREQMRRVNAALLVSVGLDKDYAPIVGTEVS